MSISISSWHLYHLYFFSRFLIINLCCILHLRQSATWEEPPSRRHHRLSWSLKGDGNHKHQFIIGYEKNTSHNHFEMLSFIFGSCLFFWLFGSGNNPNISPWLASLPCHGTEKIQRALGRIDELLLASLGKVCSHHHLRSRHHLKVAGNPVDVKGSTFPTPEKVMEFYTKKKGWNPKGFE